MAPFPLLGRELPVAISSTKRPHASFRALSYVAAVALAVTAVGCASADPTATPTAPAPTPTSTPMPTATPVPDPTSTPTPAADLTPAGDERLFLEIGQPEDESEVTTEAVAVQGTTTPDAVVSVNGAVVEVDAEGAFEAIVTLAEGLNLIEVVASDLTGAEESVDLVVVYSP